MHEIFVASDCSENIIRLLFVDFRKALDLIDYNVLFNKLLSSGVIPEHVIAWSLDFLNDRKSCSKFFLMVTLYLLQLQRQLVLLKAQWY